MIESFEPEFRRHFEIVVWCLEHFFPYDHDSALQIVEEFCDGYPESYQTDICLRENPYDMAVKFYYYRTLMRGKSGAGLHFFAWRREHGYDQIPEEAFRYWRENS